MTRTPLLLVVSEDAGCVETIREALASTEQRFAIQSVERVRTAAARIAGGGVDAVLVDLSSHEKSANEKRASVMKLRAAAAEILIVVLCEAENDLAAADAAEAGVFACVPRLRWKTELGRILSGAVEKQQGDRYAAAQRQTRPHGTVMAMLGAKGGVGTTSVALNIGASRARANRVIIAELRPAFGTLSQYLRPQAWVRSVAHLVDKPVETISQADVEGCLWPVRNIPQLSVLFAPQTLGDSNEIGPEQARTIVRHLADLADVVVLDLPASVSETNQALLRESDSMMLIVERDALCLESAKTLLGAIQASQTSPQRIGAAIVNRVPLALPMPLEEIEAQLGIPILGVIPPAADLCSSAQRARVPVILFDPESLVAGSLVKLANELSRSISPIAALQPHTS